MSLVATRKKFAATESSAATPGCADFAIAGDSVIICRATRAHSQEWLCYANLIHPAVVRTPRRFVLVIAHINFKFAPRAPALPIQVIIAESVEKQSPPQVQIP